MMLIDPGDKTWEAPWCRLWMSSRPEVGGKCIKEFIKKWCLGWALELYYFLSLMIDCLTVEYFIERENHTKLLSSKIVVSILFSSYAFTQCVKKSLSSKVGCKLPWDEQTKGKATVSISISMYLTIIWNFNSKKWAARRPVTITVKTQDQILQMFSCIYPLLFINNISLTGFPNCSKLEEFEQHEKLYVQLALKDRSNIEQLTGCLFPWNQSLKNAADVSNLFLYVYWR